MQALGIRDTNRAATYVQQKTVEMPQAGGSNSKPGVKRKRNEPGIDYTSTQRPGPSFLYSKAAIEQIVIDFPMFYKIDVRNFLARNGKFYAPAYIKLYDAAVRNDTHLLEGVRKCVKQRSTAKGKANVPSDPAFIAEFEWVHNVWKVNYDGTRTDRKRRKSLAPLASPVKPTLVVAGPDIHEDASFAVAEQSMKIECGCCFDDECSFVTMIQCSDGHLFCRDCVNAQAGTAVGGRQRDILCMDGTGCKQPFPVSELKKCLDQRTFDLWQKIAQAEDIAAAELRGFEYCPACDFGMIFEVGHDVAPLFQCLTSDCRLVTCRRCRKPDHTGRPCKNEADARLKAEHAVEEAMTQALLRKCPGCHVPFIKSDGCNKMKCLNVRCAIYSCYLCRQPLPQANPYDHFDRNPHGTGTKCKLWDPTGHGDDPQQRHAAEIAEAERFAREQRQLQAQNRIM